MERESSWASPDVSVVAERPLMIGAAGVASARGDASWPEEQPGVEAERETLAVGPVGVSGVLDGGFDFLRANFSFLVGLTAALYLPLQLVELLLVRGSGLEPEVEGPQIAMFTTLGSEGATSWTILALRVVALSFLGLVAGVLTIDGIEGRSRSDRAVLGHAARRWWVALLIPFLTTPLRVMGGCLIYIGFFLVDAGLMCASIVAGAERAGPLRSISRSWRLGWRSLGSALGISVGALVISAILQVSIYAGPALLASNFISSDAVLVVVEQVSLLTLLVTQPLTASIAARAYVEFRCRSEGLDISLRARRLGLQR